MSTSQVQHEVQSPAGERPDLLSARYTWMCCVYELTLCEHITVKTETFLVEWRKHCSPRGSRDKDETSSTHTMYQSDDLRGSHYRFTVSLLPSDAHDRHRLTAGTDRTPLTSACLGIIRAELFMLHTVCRNQRCVILCHCSESRSELLKWLAALKPHSWANLCASGHFTSSSMSSGVQNSGTAVSAETFISPQALQHSNGINGDVHEPSGRLLCLVDVLAKSKQDCKKRLVI